MSGGSGTDCHAHLSLSQQPHDLPPITTIQPTNELSTSPKQMTYTQARESSTSAHTTTAHLLASLIAKADILIALTEAGTQSTESRQEVPSNDQK